MAVRDSGKNLMLAKLSEELTHVSLHSAYPPTAENELVGGSPAYKRAEITWGAPSGGKISTVGEVVLNVPPNTTVAAAAFCTAPTGGTIHADFDVLDEVYAGQGTYTVVGASIDLNK